MPVIYTDTNAIDLEKTDTASLIKWYAGEILARLAESGGKGVRAALNEFYILTLQKVSAETKASNAAAAAKRTALIKTASDMVRTDMQPKDVVKVQKLLQDISNII